VFDFENYYKKVYSAMDKKNRVRFAPSPTGYLHVGGARSALLSTGSGISLPP
jgi:glutamyl/glutaminyl-tRNA synthetase